LSAVVVAGRVGALDPKGNSALNYVHVKVSYYNCVRECNGFVADLPDFNLDNGFALCEESYRDGGL
jgi:hypothetical protein